MSRVSRSQLRLLFSLLKPVVWFAGRFEVPMRSVVELLRLAYFEALRKQGLKQREIALQLGQSERHMRSLESKLRSGFFDAEQKVGLAREIEDLVANGPLTSKEIERKLRAIDAEVLEAEIAGLIRAERLERGANGKLRVGKRYVVLASDLFHQRIDALNHFLEAASQAIAERLIHDNRDTARIKTISFSAESEAYQKLLTELEGYIRTRIAELEEQAAFEDCKSERFTISLTGAPSAS